MRMLPGIPGMSSTKAIKARPASESLAKAAALGARKSSGANNNHPRPACCHGAHATR